ncbi:MAG: sulfatase-like hydrolase/transferase [Planctomycetes bacterium]|nr:sulfatase-like hydrolase/transferase [Planctomycetota bacterium]
MQRVLRRVRPEPRPGIGRMIAGVGLATALLLAGVELLHVFDPADPAESGQRLLGILLVLFLLQAIAAAAQGLALGVGLLGRLLARLSQARQRNAMAGLPAVVLSFFFCAPRVVDLFSGPWIAQQAWRPAALVLILVGGGFLAFRLASRLARAFLERGRFPTGAVVTAAVAAPLLFLIDAHEALARKQTALHDLLAFAALVATIIAGSRFSRLPWRRFGATQLILGVVGVALVATGIVPGESVYLREVLLGRSRVVGRVLRELLPPPSDGRIKVDRDFLAELDQGRPLPAARIDAALPGRDGFDLVLITIDTLRYDALGATGGPDERTPVMDDFIGASRFFPRAWTQFPSSRFALNTMMTGRYPTASRLWELAPGDAPVSIEATETSLAEILAGNGFRCEAATAFPADFYQREELQLTRGFERFRNDDGEPFSSSERVVARALECLGEADRDQQNLFLWVHLFDPHRPYRPRPGVDAGAPARTRYRGEISHADSCLETLLARLDFERSIVVLHSDHGEEFDDHGGSGHHSSLYEEQIRVPLAIRLPEIAAATIDRPVGLIDLRATLLEVLGIADDDRDQGRSFAAPLLGLDDLPAPPLTAFSQFREPRFVNGDLDALVVDRLKIIHDRAAGLFELYDLDEDPREARNLALVDAEALDRMRARLLAMRRHLGLDEDPIGADRGGEALIAAITRKPVPGPRDLEALMTRLRDPKPLATAALDQLLESPDGRLRRLAVLRAATYPTTPAVLSLQDWAASEDRGRQLDAAIGLALLGNEGYLEELDFMAPEFVGDARLLGLLARYAGGDAALAEAVHQVLSDPNNDRDIETLGFAVIGRMGDPRALICYYTRLILGLQNPEQRLMTFTGAEHFSFAQAAPVFRLLARHADRALRQRVRGWLADRPELAGWLEAAGRAERLAQRARDLGVSPEVMPEALGYYDQALAVMAEVGQLDWGLLMEVAFLHDVCDQRAAQAERLKALLDRLPGADPFARGLALRFIGLAETADRPLLADLEPVAGQSLEDGEVGRSLVLVRVRVRTGGAGLVGGMGPACEYLAAVALDRLDRPKGEPAVIPLPLTALLPGEEAVLAVPVILPDDLARAPRVGVRLGRADQEIAAPILIEALR